MGPSHPKSSCIARDLISGDAVIRRIKPGVPLKRLNDGDGLYLRLFVKAVPMAGVSTTPSMAYGRT